MPHHVVVITSEATQAIGMSQLLEKEFPGVLNHRNQKLKRIGFWGPKQFALHLAFVEQGHEAFDRAREQGSLMALCLMERGCVSDLRVENDTKWTSNGEHVFGRFFTVERPACLGTYKVGGPITKPSVV